MTKQITIKSVGKVSVKPDLIELTLSIKNLDNDYTKSLKNASDQLKQLHQAIINCGFDKKDLKTVDFKTTAHYESVLDKNNNYIREFQGYQTVQILKLEFNFNNKMLGEILSEIALSDIKPEINIDFTVENQEILKQKVLENASHNALVKAQILTQANNVTLGNLLSIDYSFNDINFTSQSSFSPMVDNQLLLKASYDFDIEPKEISIRDSVIFVWEIK